MSKTRSKTVYGVAAFGLGVLGFVALELFFPSPGLFDPIEAALSATAFGLATLILALIYLRFLAWARGARLLLAILPFVLPYPFVAGVIDGALQLSYRGGWGARDQVSMALVYDPINLLYDLVFGPSASFTAPLGLAVSLPLAVVVVVVLQILAGRTLPPPSRLRGRLIR